MIQARVCKYLMYICVLVCDNVYYESLVRFEKFAFKSLRQKLLYIALWDLRDFLTREKLLLVVDVDSAQWSIEREITSVGGAEKTCTMSPNIKCWRKLIFALRNTW